jgi:acid phosphatase type 7
LNTAALSRRGIIATAFSATLLLLCFLASARAQEPALSKGPYLQAPGQTAMTIMWETRVPVPVSVRFGRGDKLDQAMALAPPRVMSGISRTSRTNVFWRTKTNVVDGVTNTVSGFKTNVIKDSLTNLFYVYEAPLTNLKPSTLYSYSVLVDGIGTLVRQFKTFGHAPRKVTFIAYGDTRSFPKIHRAVARQFGTHAPDFILHTGDLVMNGKNYGQWSREFFEPLADVIDTFPLLPAIGNHEEDGTNFLAYFHLPAAERWYSFDDGPVHVLALDYHFEKPGKRAAQFEAQLNFASNDLHAARAPWKIVFLHYPMFNVGGHGTGWGHEHYLPLFREMKVDMVIGGHSHLYERFRPLTPRADGTAWPMTHITTGGGGAELARSHVHPSLAVNASTNHFVVFEVTRDRLRGTAITAAGQTLDEFEIQKQKGRIAGGYVAQTYPEEMLQLSLDAGRSLTARLTSRPDATNDAQAMFAVQPLKGLERGELEISLSPESAKYYTMAPIIVKTTSQKKEQVAWATLRATGLKKVRLTDGREFSPALVFQAHATAGSFETMVYGQPSRLSQTASNEWLKLQKTLTNIVRSARARAIAPAPGP